MAKERGQRTRLSRKKTAVLNKDPSVVDSAYSRPGPRFTKLAKPATGSLDRSLEHASVSQDSVPNPVAKAGSRIVKFGDISAERLQELIHPWGSCKTPSPTRTSESAETVLGHAKYRISLSSSEDELIVASHIKQKKKIFERTRSKKANSTKEHTVREKTHEEETHLSRFNGTEQLEKSKDSAGSKSVTPSVHTFIVQHRQNEAPSKSHNSKHDQTVRQQLMDSWSSEEEIYKPTASRVQQRKTDAKGKAEKFKGKTSKRLYRENKSSEPEDVFDLTSANSSPAAKGASKEKTGKLASRAYQRSPVASTSQNGQSASASKRKSTSRERSAGRSDGEKSGSTSTTERRLFEDLRRRLFETSDNSIEDGLARNVEGSEGGLEHDNVPEDRSDSSRTSHKSLRKDRSAVRDAAAHQSLSKFSRLADLNVIEKNQSSFRKSSGSSVSSGHHSSVETSTDGTMITVSPRRTSTPKPSPVSSRASPAAHPKRRTSAESSRDSSHTPADAGPSTLKPPVKRLMMFSFDTTGDECDDDSDEERAPVVRIIQRTAVEARDDALDVSNLAAHLRRLPNSPSEEKDQGAGNVSAVQTSINDHDRARKREVKARAIAEQLRVAEEKRRELELQKQRIDDGSRRLQARKEYRRKLRKRKPVDKAFLLDGQIYKPSRLPRPKPWAANKLHEYLMKCMEKKCGWLTKAKAERFVVRLAKFATMIAKKKKYEKYAAVELEELMVRMAKLRIIETRHDFYGFCWEFTPYSFREKVVPIAVPGKGTNIPYFAELTNVPLASEENAREEDAREENAREEIGSDSSSSEDFQIIVHLVLL